MRSFHKLALAVLLTGAAGYLTPAAALTNKKVAVILLNFRNDTSQPFTTDQLRRAVFTNPDSSNAYYKESSLNKVGFAGKIRSDGDVYGWYTIDQDKVGCGTDAWADAADQKASAAGVDMSGYDFRIYVWPHTDVCGFGGTYGFNGRIYINKVAGTSEKSLAAYISHETGHSLGLSHAPALDCNQGGVRVPLSDSCTTIARGDRFTVMGQSGALFTSVEKERLGYLAASNVFTWSSDGDYVIAPQEVPGSGIILLKIPRGGGKYLYLEHRQNFGAFDQFTGARASATNGVLFRTEGANLMSDSPIGLLDMTPATASYDDAALTVGKTYHNAAANFYVQVMSVSSTGATVRIKHGAPPADTTPPTISSVAAGSITSSGATITWSTNEASDSQVEYGLTTSYGSATPVNGSMVTAHSVALSGLQAGNTYNYRVKSKDAAGNLAVSGNFTFTTPGGTSDTTPPTISNVQAGDITASGARITWTTNEASDSQVQYGTSTAYGSATPVNTSLVTSHSVSVSGLQAGRTYHYRVKSRDAAGNFATSADFTFTTSSGTSDTTPPTISSVQATNITSSGAKITWSTNEASDSQVEYGLTTSYGSATPVHTSMVTSHAVNLSSLQAGKTYNYRVKSKDAAGNLRISGNFTFTTTAATVSPPAAPSGLTASPDTALGGIRLSWSDNSSNEEGFKIERKPYGGVYAQIAAVGANVRSYHDTTATNTRAIYAYRVRAYNAGGHSAYSNEAYSRPYMMGQAVLAGQAGERFLSPGLADGRNDKAVFGPEAEEVVIVDANGSLVFQGASDGTGPIVWDGKGRDGHVVPSGAYIAQIRQEDGQVVYQTLAIVK